MKRNFGHLVFSVTLALSLSLAGAARAEGDNPDGEGLSATQTSYVGARLLKGGSNVKAGSIKVGPYQDTEKRQRYVYWQGDTMFAGVKNPETGNKVDLVAEWYWFESSIPRNADFYVGVVKVKSSPNPVDSWYIKEGNNWFDDIMWPDDVAQILEVEMDPSGKWGGLRWDWCVPFDSYKWEPDKKIEVASGYSAGFDAEAGFSEGGILKDLTDKSNIQAKGYVNAKHSVSTKYTITLYKWQVLVSSGADNTRWQMRILKGGNNEDSAYHEYFVVIQAAKGTQVWIPEIDFAGNFRQGKWYWFDGYEALSATIKDVTFTPPPTCYVDDEVPAGICKSQGVCSAGAGLCDIETGEWACNYPDEYQAEEKSCDGMDNDCDGKIDENFPKLGLACDGDDMDANKDGIFVCNVVGDGVACDEDPCAGKQCGDGCGECDMGQKCVNFKCVSAEDPVDPNEGSCGAVTETGMCDGNWLYYCAGGKIVEQQCAFCCGFDNGAGYHTCLGQDKCINNGQCTPNCNGKSCGSDGCGGVCGLCAADESCSLDGKCVADNPDEGENGEALLPCDYCPEGYLCGPDGDCVLDVKADGIGAEDAAAQGCAASFAPAAGGSAAALLMALAGALLLALRRRSQLPRL